MAHLTEGEVIVSLVASGLIRAHTWVTDGTPLSVPYPDALQRGLDRLTLVCLGSGESPPTGVPELFRWCEYPVGQWCQIMVGSDVADDVLMESGVPSRACHEWSVTAGDVEAELFEADIVAEVRRACRASGRQDTYEAFRRYVIEHPVLTDLDLYRARIVAEIEPIEDQFSKCYPPVPVECEQDGTVWCCYDCGNVLLPTLEGFRCGDDRCPRRHSPRAGRGLSAAEGVRWLAPPIRTFVASPGRAELRLAHQLVEVGADVQLWPNFDAYDLRVTFADGTGWAVDVKDWSNPVRLARDLQPIPHDPPWQRAFIVPAHEAVSAQPGYLQTLRQRAKPARKEWGVEVASEYQLRRKVREKVTGHA